MLSLASEAQPLARATFSLQKKGIMSETRDEGLALMSPFSLFSTLSFSWNFFFSVVESYSSKLALSSSRFRSPDHINSLLSIQESINSNQLSLLWLIYSVIYQIYVDHSLYARHDVKIGDIAVI